MTQQHFQTVICGAGVSGLYSAWRLLEAGHDPGQLVILEATDRIGGRLWSRHLHRESRLHDWGFWNLLARVISNKVCQALRDFISSHTMLTNWNGYDAMVSLVVEQAGNWYRLTGGYQHLPERLAAEIEKAGTNI